MFRNAMVAVVLCLVTLSAGFAVDAKARGLMAHNPWPGTDTELSEVVVHESPVLASASAEQRALDTAQGACVDGQALALSVAEVSVDAGGETSTQVEISYRCLPG